MKHRSFLDLARMWRCIRVGVLLLALGGCGSVQRLPVHSFAFDAIKDSPDAEILDYRYGNSRHAGASAPDWQKARGQVSQGGGVNGAMLRGDSLYVKWRIKSTGQIYEETVDLKACTPADITDHIIYFVVKGTNLAVYLVSPHKRTERDLPSPLRMYSNLKVTTIHPTCTRLKHDRGWNPSDISSRIVLA